MLYQHRRIIETTQIVIPKGKSHLVRFPVEEVDPTGYRFKLRLRGDVDIQQNWMWEGGYPLLYRDIDDALDSEMREESPFSLHFNLRPHLGRQYPRRVYCKLPCPLTLTPQFPVPGGGQGSWLFSLRVKAENVTFLPEGAAGVRFEIWRKKDGVLPRDINGEPDETITIPFATGSYPFTDCRRTLEITGDEAMILLTIYADNCEGDFWLENPRFEKDGQQLLPQFTISNPHHEYLNWLGENLSRKEWTDLQVTVNGTALPAVELFQRCHRGCEHEIAIPDGLLVKGENSISLVNQNDYFGALGFRLFQCELLYEEKAPFERITYPVYPAENGIIPILVSVPKAGTTISISCDNPAVTLPKTVTAERAGLLIIKGTIRSTGEVEIILTADGFTETCNIRRTVKKEPDNVLTGTSDSIYIPQDDLPLTTEFLSWYFHNRLGNFITFRPVYRWTGGRTLTPETWEEIRRVCTELETYFCHIIDGRELPGMNANPTKAMLDSPYFVGNQGHERDGALYYWRPRRAEGSNLLFNEIFQKNHDHPDYRYSAPICYRKDQDFLHFDPISPKNMEEAAMQYVERSRVSLAGIKRHTGPSVLFRYFFMAGLEVGGAELMYGPQEIILSALRGASLAYNRAEFAAHLAVQWSSSPHDTPERFARFRLALLVCYLQGVHHINTEEGLYRMEEWFSVFDRFSDGCLGHLKAQQDFAEFVATHSRRGKLRSPIGLLHGRYDGFVCFTRPNVWAHFGDEWKFGNPEESWDLLTLFYPDSKLRSLYVHPCPNEPQGFFSRTPHGSVDILPIEASTELLESYPYLAFMGYNAATEEQLLKLISYVEKGGTLLLTLAHLNTSLERDDINGNCIKPPSGKLVTKLLGFEPDYTETAGYLVTRKLGKGIVYLVNSCYYPAHSAIRPIYEKCLLTIAKDAATAEEAKGYIETSDTVQFTVFDQEDGTRTIYLINTNWWELSHTHANATLRYQGKSLPLSVPFGQICTLTLWDGKAVFTSDNTTEVVCMNADETVIQGDPGSRYWVACDQNWTEHTV